MKIANNLPKFASEETKAPISHSSVSKTYGGGTSLEYGHVKLSDNYTESDGTADSSVGASSKAISDCYNNLNSSLNNRTLIKTHTVYDKWSGAIDITNVKWLEIIQKDSTTNNVILTDFSSVKGSYASASTPKMIYKGSEPYFQYFVNSSTNVLYVFNRISDTYLEVYACF